jgi:hypothetical protein
MIAAGEHLLDSIERGEDPGDLFGPPDLSLDPLEGMEATPSVDLQDPGAPRPLGIALERFSEEVHQRVLGADLDDGLKLPWEQGICACIFGDEDLVPLPSVPKVKHSINPNDYPTAHPEPVEVGTAVKRQKALHTGPRLYERVISFSVTMTDPELDHAKWNRALEKLFTVFTLSPMSKPDGLVLDDEDMLKNFERIRQLCGARSANTILKRANSLLAFCSWHKQYYYGKDAFPLSSEYVASYVWERHQDGVPYSNLIAFVESLNFATHVLNLPMIEPTKPLVDAFTKGIS